MSQFSENDSSLISQVRGETFSIDLELHAEGFPFHKWELLDSWDSQPLLSDWNKNLETKFACVGKVQINSVVVLVLLCGSFTHTSKKLINSENGCKSKGRLFHS